jgi:hypothetical protein
MSAERGTIKELKAQREKVIRWWKIHLPNQTRPLGCVDCARLLCSPKCKGVLDKGILIKQTSVEV